jgi:hypothetical protein
MTTLRHREDMTNDESGHTPAQNISTTDSPSTGRNPTIAFRTVTPGLYDPPDTDYFEAAWEMPEPSIGVIVRRGQDWRPALLNAIREEFDWWINALTESGLAHNEARFAVLDPIAADRPLD